MEIANRETLSKIFNVLSSEARIKALELFEGNKDLSQITKITGMSRSGFQKIVDNFREAGLIERFGHRSVYRLTCKGAEVLKAVKDFDNKLGFIEEKSKKENLKALIAKFGAGLSEEDLLSLVKEIKEEDKDSKVEE